MSRKNGIYFRRKFTAGILAIAIASVGFLAVPKDVDAAVAADEVIYEEYTNVGQYRGATKTAPVKEGYVFGGWYDDANGTNYYDEEGADSLSTAYAKFVPAQVLSVKAQNMAGTTADTETTHVRVISSLDNTNYQKVGFDIWLNNKIQLTKEGGTPLETEKIYNGLLVGDQKVEANDIFGGVSQFVSVWQLQNVAKENHAKIIYVRPYWITMDGTKVEGLGKYVHIEDQYNGLISVPVDLMTGEGVAAGAVNLTYPSDMTVEGVENGRVFDEMACDTNTAGVVKMVANTSDVSDVAANGIYANIRFRKPAAKAEFTVTKSEFCNNAETMQDTKAWDTAYAPTTTGQ